MHCKTTKQISRHPNEIIPKITNIISGGSDFPSQFWYTLSIERRSPELTTTAIIASANSINIKATSLYLKN